MPEAKTAAPAGVRPAHIRRSARVVLANMTVPFGVRGCRTWTVSAPRS